MDDLGIEMAMSRAVTMQEIHSAQLTMVELGKYCEGDVSREEMADLLSMITPKSDIQVSVVTRLGRK